MTEVTTPATSRHWGGERYEQWVARTNVPLLLLAVLLIPILLIPYVGTVSRGTQRAFDTADYVIWAVFVVDYLARLWLATRKWLFVRHNLFDLVLVAIPMLRPLRILRAARMLRALRLGRLAVLLTSGQSRARLSLQYRAVAYVSLTAVVLTGVCSLFVLDLERNARGSNIHSFGDALWWAVSTVSTAGYGDRYPVTTGGRVVAFVLMVAGVSLFGVITAAIASTFVRHLRQPDEVTTADLAARLERIEASLARLDTVLCLDLDRSTAALAMQAAEGGATS